MIGLLDEEQFSDIKTHCLCIFNQVVQYFSLDKYNEDLEKKIIPRLIDISKDTIKKFPDVFTDSFASNKIEESDLFIIKDYLCIFSIEKFIKVEQELTLELREKFLESFRENERQRR
jgi:hypothetical protein